MKVGKIGIKALVLVLIMFYALAAIAWVTGVEAPEEEEFELGEVTIEDNGTELAISIDEVSEYVTEKIEDAMGSVPEDMEMFVSGAYRATLLGISEVWEGEVPSRDDIKIVSSLPEPASALCFQYITGTGPSMENLRAENGVFEIVLQDGTLVENTSVQHLYELSKNITADDWKFEISSISTGESFVVEVKGDVFPEDFFGLREKVVFGQTASEKEGQEFTWEWSDINDGFQGFEDYEIFEGLEEPAPDSATIVALIAVILAIVILALII
ncbi:MAG: hypothetical protein DRN83_01660 [Hadesarchaea archaeon]|nr:MAG: hypothetical protein DRN83_01660 [Hadesarchaea archaeon]